MVLGSKVRRAFFLSRTEERISLFVYLRQESLIQAAELDELRVDNLIGTVAPIIRRKTSLKTI